MHYVILIPKTYKDRPYVYGPFEHSYFELGGWIGDQGLAMQYMALGKILGLWQVMHPGMILNVNDPAQKQLADQMAGAGMVSILGNKKP